MPLTIPKPAITDYPEFYHTYVSKLPAHEDVLTLLEQQHEELQLLLQDMEEARANEAYAEGKWSVKELLQHMIDTERIFAYRALCIARGETGALPGFDENSYAENAYATKRPIKEVLDEYSLVRRSNLYLFRSFAPEVIRNVGNANGKPIALHGLIHIVAGHERHHIDILLTRYLKLKKEV